MDHIIGKIKESRKNSETTLKGYISSLKRVEKIQEQKLHKNFIINTSKVDLGLKKIPITSRKNILISIIVELKALDKNSEKWAEKLKKENEQYREYLESQVLTDTQKKN